MTTAAHYRLTSDEFLNINSKLSDAQLRVYLYYKTQDPFGDRKVEVCTKAIAEILDIKQRTVQRALNKLCYLGLLIWEKAKSFVRRSVDRLGDLQIAQAIVGSPKRSEDRERQLELNLEADSGTSQSSSILFNLDHDLEQENFESIEDKNEISVEEAIAEIRKAFEDNPQAIADNPRNEDLLLSNEDEERQDFEEISEPKTDLQLRTVGNANSSSEGKPSRAAVEQFVLKTLNKTFTSAAQRAAYFSKFDSKSWKKWETQLKASLIPQAPYKAYLPEKVEVAPPDSPVALSAIAQIKAKLGIKKP
jgi:predicted transcriptional regulator